MSRDPVESEPAYQYVRGNPIIYIDPSGMQCPDCPPEPGTTATPGPILGPVPTSEPTINGNPKPHYYSIASELKDANGYVEGSVSIVAIGPCLLRIFGEEIVYDFATRERQRFTYREASNEGKGILPLGGGIGFTRLGYTTTDYAGLLWGFDKGSNIQDQYSGYFWGTSLGISGNLPVKEFLESLGIYDLPAQGRVGSLVGGSIGMGMFGSTSANFGGPGVRGKVLYITHGLSRGLKNPYPIGPDASLTETYYYPGSIIESYKGQELQMIEDVLSGNSSPIGAIQFTFPFKNTYGRELKLDMRSVGAAVGANTFAKDGLPFYEVE